MIILGLVHGGGAADAGRRGEIRNNVPSGSGKGAASSNYY